MIRSRRVPLVLVILFVLLSLHYWYSMSTTSFHRYPWSNEPYEAEIILDGVDQPESPERLYHPNQPISPHHHHQPKPIPPNPNPKPPSHVDSPAPPAAPPSPWSSAEEYFVGNWIPREPQYTSWDSFKAVNAHKAGWIWSGCRVYNDTHLPDTPEKISLRQSRLVDLMNWTWNPSRGSLVPVDPVSFVVRLLQSPAGLIMFGDSITRQHHDALIVWLAKEEVYHDNVKEDYVTSYTLRPNGPRIEEIRKKAGVPEGRLKRPFLTLIEDHMILPEEDIRKVANAAEDWVWPIRHHPHVKDLIGILRDRTRPVEAVEEGVGKDSILLFSTGPHWSRSRLPIPQTGYKEERAAMLDIYNKMLQILLTRFTTLSRTKVFYRSSASPHPQCETHIKPFPSLEVALQNDAHMFELHTRNPDPSSVPPSLQGVQLTLELAEGEGEGEGGTQVRKLDIKPMGEQERRNHARWDWDLWRVYNQMWEDRIGELMRERRVQEEAQEGAKGEGAEWYYLDISLMSMQRPDAHAEPGDDCLHYCTPTIYETWTQMFYHRLFLLGELPEPAQEKGLDAEVDTGE